MAKELTTKNIKKQKSIPFSSIVQVEKGEDFQEYRYKKDKKKVPHGTSIGYEKNVFGTVRLILCNDVELLSDH